MSRRSLPGLILTEVNLEVKSWGSPQCYNPNSAHRIDNLKEKNLGLQISSRDLQRITHTKFLGVNILSAYL